MNKTYKHCGMDIAIRNPSGYCDHLHYPENCDVCKSKAESLLKSENKLREIFRTVDWCDCVEGMRYEILINAILKEFTRRK
jgi:hypothetical protein